MNKNVIALAVAAAMAAPLAAQADVKVSGQLQMEVASVSGDGAVEGLYLTDGMEGASQNSGNAGAISISASEDLGNGLKAMAKYTMNIKPDVTNQGDRDAYVGLSGNFGTVLAGTLSNPYKTATVKWDPFLATAAQARGSNGMSALHNSYVGNVIAYANKFGMVKVVAAYAIDESKGVDAADDIGGGPGGVAGDGVCNGTEICNGKTNGNNAMALSVNMPVGPVELALGYMDATDYTTTHKYSAALPAGTTFGDFTAMKVGVKYNAGALTVAGQFEDLDVGLADNINYMYLTGSYAMGANTFSASYGTEDDGTDTNGYMALGMKHAFSKKTSVHVVYRASDDDSVADADVSVIAAGLRVKF